MHRTLILLSGGLDSTAAAIWAKHTGLTDVRALSLYYGQPNGQREGERAASAARALDIPLHRSDISGVFYGSSAGVFRARPSCIEHGVDVAFVPGRNALLLATAAARAAVLWPERPIDVTIVAGFNADDAAGFPDCRPAFVIALRAALEAGLGEGDRIDIATPWAHMTKAEVVAWVRTNAPARLPLLEDSWSCYRERGPCGECTACKTRAAAWLAPAH